MKTLGEIIENKEITVREQGTALANPRHQPMQETFRIPTKRDGKLVPVYDQAGNYLKDEFELFDIPDYSGLSADQVREMNVPTSLQNTVYHLTRLAAHLRDTKGSVSQYVLEDLANDLRGYSEWAVMEACKWLRQNRGPFFPQTKEIIERVKHFDGLARTMDKIDE